ncbi:helix-turn-helix transcriptional regulator [Nocardioides sp. 31GB23]|uniref:helix-turn-helix domain-containing protein n=1 Tax=unclassified Nocardioides TaxID=2615069 RepID=UPI0003C7F6EE|nr:helix-turn-helix transcriptional regulator [Nocardioides sp.]
MPRTSRPRLGYAWHLRRLMAERGMYATTELRPLLTERGIELSEAQIYRMVTGTPERLSLRMLVALCDILAVTPNDLIEPVAETAATRATGTNGAKPAKVSATSKARTPRRAEITPKK